MRIGKRDFDLKNKTYVMGILNVTPDSFSDGGRWNRLDLALNHTQQMIEDGAALIDIGGESTRPGYERISEEEEIDRLAGVISEIKKRFDTPLSVDTYKARVAAAALDAGADMVNDIWGLKGDPDMGSLLARKKVSCCLMHNRKRKLSNELLTNDILDIIKGELNETLDLAEEKGILRENIILDPGVGFAKTKEQNLMVIHHLSDLRVLGCPLLLGTSRKSVIGDVLRLPVGDRLEGTLATSVFAVLSGCGFVRVHDVKENVRVIRMTEAILKA